MLPANSHSAIDLHSGCVCVTCKEKARQWRGAAALGTFSLDTRLLSLVLPRSVISFDRCRYAALRESIMKIIVFDIMQTD